MIAAIIALGELLLSTLLTTKLILAELFTAHVDSLPL